VGFLRRIDKGTEHVDETCMWLVRGYVQDLKADLEMARKPPTQNLLRREYVLPDGLKHTRGYVKVGCHTAIRCANPCMHMSLKLAVVEVS
jgi:hypothetical protein